MLLTHSHPDHFDEVSSKTVPNYLPIFYTPVNESNPTLSGFSNRQVVKDSIEWNGITITRSDGQHGSGIFTETFHEQIRFLGFNRKE